MKLQRYITHIDVYRNGVIEKSQYVYSTHRVEKDRLIKNIMRDVTNAANANHDNIYYVELKIKNEY